MYGATFTLIGAVVLYSVSSVTCCVFSSKSAPYPWIVRIIVRKTSTQLCVGNLISDMFVTTPVNCFRRWSVLPNDYHDAKDLMVIVGRDDDPNHCSQERPGIMGNAHINYTTNVHAYDVAMLEVERFDFDENYLPTIPYLPNEKQNTAALLKIQKEKSICRVPTFKATRYLKNILEDEDAMDVRIIDPDECWRKYCPRGHKACLPFFNKKTYVCAQFVKQEKRCLRHDVGAPLVCNDVALGVMKLCRDNRPMLFQGFTSIIIDSYSSYQNMSTKVRQWIREEKNKKPFSN